MVAVLLWLVPVKLSYVIGHITLCSFQKSLPVDFGTINHQLVESASLSTVLSWIGFF